MIKPSEGITSQARTIVRVDERALFNKRKRERGVDSSGDKQSRAKLDYGAREVDAGLKRDQG